MLFYRLDLFLVPLICALSHEELLAVVSVVGSLGLLFLLEWVGSAMALWLGTARATALRPALAALAAALLFGAWDLRVNRPSMSQNCQFL